MGFSDLPRGTLLGGKYKVEGMLGQGGMGSVYQAVNSFIGRTVAIKLLDAKLADNADFVHRFQMEAKAAALISHPGIVDVLDMGETDEGMPFIVMEYLEGVTLKSFCKRSGALSASQAVAIMVPVLDALVAAHAAGVIHRDLKPANIFVCLKPTPAVKILDFGISKFSTSGGITQTGTSMGTPAYMSPEQVRGDKAIGPQSDLYSIGAILYNLVSGHPPFEGESDLAVVARVLTDLHRPLAIIRPDLPEKLSTIVDRLLIKQSDQRPANAAQVKRALEAVAKPDYDSVWKLAKNAFDSDTATALKSQREAQTTPTTPTGGQRSKPKAVRQTQPTRAEAPPAPNRMPLVLIAGLVLAAGGGFATWKALQKAPVAVPVTVEELPTPVEPVGVAPKAPQPVERVMLTISADPATARIVIDGDGKDCNPCKLQRAAGAKARISASADGFVPRTMDVVFETAREVTLALVPVPVPVQKAGVKATVKKGEKPKGLQIDSRNPYE